MGVIDQTHGDDHGQELKLSSVVDFLIQGHVCKSVEGSCISVLLSMDVGFQHDH